MKIVKVFHKVVIKIFNVIYFKGKKWKKLYEKYINLMQNLWRLKQQTLLDLI